MRECREFARRASERHPRGAGGSSAGHGRSTKGVVLAACACAGLAGLAPFRSVAPSFPARASGVTSPDTPTFAPDVAPILYRNCVVCHRPGGVAPFPLLTYPQAKAKADRIARMTSTRRMPPWLPEPGIQPIEGERRLTEEEIETLRRWAETGAPLGDPAALPDPPSFGGGWELGEPDLVLRMPEPFTVPAGGTDLYRNFVIPVPPDSRGWIEAMELRPGDLEVVHHAVLMVDRTRGSRRLAERDPAPGYEGMHAGGTAQLPEGFFPGWTPGRRPSREREGTAWPLDGETDLVLQLHLRPTAEPRTVRAEVGLHFAEGPPERRPVLVKLVNELLDIPAGDADYVVHDELPLPVAVRVLSVYPHAHYLAREMKGYATLPDGSVTVLFHIRDWDFDWQDQYRFVDPVFLPAGSTVHMEYSYDNSAANPQNPSDPPVRVLRGLESTDEMAELLVQLLADDPSDDPILRSWVSLMGPRTSADEYVRHYRSAVEHDPGDADARYRLGVALDVQGRSGEAIPHLREAVRIDPEWWRPMVALAWILAASPDEALRVPEDAVRWAERAIELTEEETPEAWDALGAARAAAGRFEEAIEAAERARALAEARDRSTLAAEITARIASYRLRRPFVRSVP